eukprot:1140268-Pelagomonas_calceolata.AAC.1
MEQLFGTGAWHHPPSPVGCGKELNPPLNFTRMEGHQKKEKDLSGGRRKLHAHSAQHTHVIQKHQARHWKSKHVLRPRR